MIFDSRQRTDWEIKHYLDSNYSFLEKSAWPVCSFVRQLINEWATVLPADNEMISKIKSKEDSQHNAALLELLFFAVVSKHGLDIRKNGAGEKKSTDFTITLTGNLQVLAECTLSANAMESIEQRRKVSSVVQMIEDFRDCPFHISIEFLQFSDESLPKKSFVAFLEKICAYPAPGLHTKFNYEDHGWRLQLSLIKKNNNERRNLGAIMQPAKSINNYKALFTALNDKKPKRYNITDNPYIICLGIDDLTVHDYDLSDVLFGPAHPDDIHLRETNDGFFVHHGRPVNTKVSAVIFCSFFKPFALQAASMKCYHNPFAANPLPGGVFPAEEYNYNISLHRNKINEGQPVIEIIEIDKDKYFEGFWDENRQKPKS